MPKGPKGEKRPADVIGKRSASQDLTGEVEEDMGIRAGQAAQSSARRAGQLDGRSDARPDRNCA